MSRRLPRFARHGNASARVGLLAMYGEDEEFGAALEALYERRYVGQEWPLVTWRLRRIPAGQAVLDDLRATAGQFGLHRMGQDGVDALHRWCLMRAQLGPKVTPREIISGLGDGYAVPTEAQELLVGWRPDLESRADAEARLTHELTAALDRIQADWQAAGWTFHHAAPKALSHLHWLFLRMRHGWSYGEIARREGVRADENRLEPDKTVQTAVHRMAQAAGIELGEGNI